MICANEAKQLTKQSNDTIFENKIWTSFSIEAGKHVEKSAKKGLNEASISLSTEEDKYSMGLMKKIVECGYVCSYKSGTSGDYREPMDYGTAPTITIKW